MHTRDENENLKLPVATRRRHRGEKTQNCGVKKANRTKTKGSDITERKRAEKALRESELRFKELFENMSSGVAVYEVKGDGKDFIIKNFNKSAERIENTRREEIIGKSVLKVFPGVRDLGLLEIFQRVWRTGKSEHHPASLYKDKRIVGWRENYVYKLPSGEIAAVYEDVTVRKQAEEALRKSEREKELILGNVAEMISYLDRELRIVWTNKAAGDMAGMPPQEMIGHYCYEIWCNAERPCTDCLVKKAVETGQPQEGEVRSDSKVWFMRGYPVLGDDGSVLGVVETALDITERKMIEEALAREHSLLRSIVDTLPDYIYVKDVNSRFVFGNTSVASHLGVKSPEELSGKTDFDFFPKEMAQRFLNEEHEIIRSGKVMLDSERSSKIDRAHTVTKVPWRDDKGNIIGIIGINHDITDRKKAEDAILKSEREKELILSNVTEVITYQDRELRIVWANKAASDLAGVSAHELVGHHCYEVWQQTDKPCTGCPVEKVFETGQPQEVEMADPHGKVWFKQGCPVLDNDGNISGVVETALDITNRKRTEKKLTDYQGQLRAMSSKLSLAEEHQRHQIAAKLHDSIGQDLALSVLKLDTLKKSVSSDTAGELDKVKKTIEKTIQDTRTLSFDLSSPTLYRFGFVRAIEQWISEQIQEKHGIKATFVESGKIGPLDEDVSVVLFQTVREVLVNVIKHAHAKSVKVSIRPIDGKIETIIKDDGVGFDTSEIGSFVHKSSGFGLFNIRERLNYLGGDIKIESRPGHGTRITLTAPLQTEKIEGDN